MFMATETETKRIVMVVPSDFHRRLKIAAATEGKDMRDLVVECVSACLDSRGAEVETLKSQKPKA